MALDKTDYCLILLVVLSVYFLIKYNGLEFSISTGRYSSSKIKEGFATESKGEKGDKGERGLPGVKGERGDKGEKGDRGEKGEKGDRGENGERGEKGERGERGEKGDRGERGERGEKGDRGERGEKGERGDRGIQGDPGTFGENTCIFVGSNNEKNWKCPNNYPIYAGASMGNEGSGLRCSGGVAQNATCSQVAGVGAVAKPIVDENGTIIDAKITSNGRDYLAPPRVKITNGGAGSGFSGEAVIANGRVVGVNIVSGGSKYERTSNMEFVSVDSGFGAKAIAFIRDGTVRNIGMSSTGSGYKVPPRVTISGGSGSGAKARAEVEDGKVTNIIVLEGGSGYTFAPTVTLETREAKNGCNYCHLCCKKGPDMTKSTETKLELQLKKHENLIQKLMGRAADIPSMLISPAEAKQQIRETAPAPASAPAPPPPQPRTQEDVVDWTQNGTVTQSSVEYDGYIAIRDDGKAQKTTFSSTQMKENSWWQVELENPIEFDSTYIDVNLLDLKEMLLKIEFENSNGVVIGSATKNATFSNRVISVETADIGRSVVVKKVKITCIKPKVAKLALYRVKVLGKRAKSCISYENEFKRIREENMGRIMDNQYNTINTRDLKKFQSLHESCIAKREESKETRQEVIKENANKYREMMKTTIEKKEKEAQEARDKLVAISKQMLKEEELAAEARSLGVEPPPPMYTQKDVEELRKKANYMDKMKAMTDEKAAKCMSLFNQYKFMKNQTEDLANKVASMPVYMDELQETGRKASDLYNEYNTECA
jgi:hypothetical protein